ncbi:2-oxoacid:acceptor oxidoreductase family protein [Sporanaerobacter acetigenes]|uniref:2-oxoglutarate ferredoxin oxidoreductase subunit gamma n=1 Tax=Sporanaerobacter acetigenes DSM 13106 TaxID=1123281 RepID=A0A1M5XB20_9FIRM|nr:2-oxoacid:acceptor oxidoreductase family protein [Sporanaerobacter acetigenes]SHH96758.1 2-oxoglutarate ferredoxin oxidoreductase subunit gamma [Sporanaerobacter acetigenes DSM 13106]
MESRIVFAGFGGQGVMAMGQLITYAGMIEDKNVSWLPSYGPEMRGGTANCGVVVADEPVGSPVVVDATSAVVMNKPSLDKFEKDIVPGGKLFINSSLIDKKATREDIDVYYIPVNEIAIELGNDKVANMVMLGAYLEATKLVKVESILEAFTKVFGESKARFLPLNEKAIKRGAEAIKSQL